jgi:hypothetical protein
VGPRAILDTVEKRKSQILPLEVSTPASESAVSQFSDFTVCVCVCVCVYTHTQFCPSSYPVGTRDLSLVVKWPGHEADHSPTSSAKVKECVELYLHSPIHLHGEGLN